MNSNQIAFLTLIMNALLAQLSIYLYLPSMPAMRADLHTTNTHIQLTYSYFMLGMGIAVFFSGYLIKKMGYRKLLIINNLLFSLSTAIIFFIDKVMIFLILRTVQGIGCALGSVFIIMVIIREQYQKEASIHIFSFLLSGLALIPIFAPFVGGYIQEIFGWKGNFFILLLISAGLMILTFLLFPHIENKNTDSQKPFLEHIKKYLRDKNYLANTLYSLLIVNIIICYNVASPFLLQDNLAVSAILNGWLAALIGFMFSFGSFCNSGLIKKYNREWVIKIGFFVSTLGVALFLVFSYITNSILTIVGPFAMTTFGLAILYPNLTSYAYEYMKENALFAASLFATINIISNFLTAYLIAIIPEESPVYCALIVTLLQVLLLSYFLKKPQPR